MEHGAVGAEEEAGDADLADALGEARAGRFGRDEDAVRNFEVGVLARGDAARVFLQRFVQIRGRYTSTHAHASAFACAPADAGGTPAVPGRGPVLMLGNEGL